MIPITPAPADEPPLIWPWVGIWPYNEWPDPLGWRVQHTVWPVSPRVIAPTQP